MRDIEIDFPPLQHAPVVERVEKEDIYLEFLDQATGDLVSGFLSPEDAKKVLLGLAGVL